MRNYLRRSLQMAMAGKPSRKTRNLTKEPPEREETL